MRSKTKIPDIRQIVLDTETTGINPKEGHKIIEIGCVELINRRLSNNHWHCYLNPEREIDAGALAVHGISQEFLSNKPKFADIVEDLLKFVAGCELIIHNAPFDIGFLNHELALINHQARIDTLCPVFDTLAYARKKHPGARNNLDALCKRYEVDNSKRDLHGALLDAEILASVYLIMTGGQISLLDDNEFDDQDQHEIVRLPTDRPALKIIYADQQEILDHQQNLDLIAKNSGGQCLWQTLLNTHTA